MKYIVLCLCVLINICLGGIYAWSVFVPDLITNYGYKAVCTQFIYGSTILILTITMLWAGRLEKRYGPRIITLASGALVCLGYFISSLSGSNAVLLCVGYTLIVGTGIGCGYVSVLAAGVRWLPDHKGLACGIAVAGYGAGAILLSSVSQYLLNNGWSVMRIFFWTGIVYGSVILICASVLHNPACIKTESVPAIPYRKLFSDRKIWALFLGIGGGTFPGLMIIGNLKPLAESFGLSVSIAVLAITFVSIGSASGRVGWGFLHDKFGPKTVKVLLFMIAVMCLAILLTQNHNFVFLGIILLVGFLYGGCLSAFPAQVAMEYGQHQFGVVYPLVILAHGLAAPFGASVGGYLYDVSGNYVWACIVCFAVSLTSLLLYGYIYGKPKSVPAYESVLLEK